MRCAGHVAQKGAMGNAYRKSVGKLEGKRTQGITRCRWLDNIKMNLRKDSMLWTGLIWLRIGSSGGLL
jgi:hypothetical protein